MIAKSWPPVTVLTLAIGASSACHTAPKGESETAPANWSPLSQADLARAKERVDFTIHVKPILEAKCLACHSGPEAVAGFSMENRARAFAAGAGGPRIVPGDPARSPLVNKVSSDHASLNVMPPVGHRVLPAELDILSRWIKEGAEWPTGAAGALHVQR